MLDEDKKVFPGLQYDDILKVRRNIFFAFGCAQVNADAKIRARHYSKNAKTDDIKKAIEAEQAAIRDFLVLHQKLNEIDLFLPENDRTKFSEPDKAFVLNVQALLENTSAAITTAADPTLNLKEIQKESAAADPTLDLNLKVEEIQKEKVNILFSHFFKVVAPTSAVIGAVVFAAAYYFAKATVLAIATVIANHLPVILGAVSLMPCSFAILAVAAVLAAIMLGLLLMLAVSSLIRSNQNDDLNILTSQANSVT